jgi:hypothetical protein
MVHGSSELRLAVIRRRVKVAALMAKGVSNQYTILVQLGMEPNQQSTISRDIRVIYRWWQLRVARKYDKHVAQQVARLEWVLDEASAAWERSKQPRESTRSRTGDRGKSAELKKEQRDGNPKFLDVIVKTTDKLCELLDLNPAKRILHGDAASEQATQEPTQKYDLRNLTVEDALKLREIRKKLLTPRPGENGEQSTPSRPKEN